MCASGNSSFYANLHRQMCDRKGVVYSILTSPFQAENKPYAQTFKEILNHDVNFLKLLKLEDFVHMTITSISKVIKVLTQLQFSVANKPIFYLSSMKDNI